MQAMFQKQQNHFKASSFQRNLLQKKAKYRIMKKLNQNHLHHTLATLKIYHPNKQMNPQCNKAHPNTTKKTLQKKYLLQERNFTISKSKKTLQTKNQSYRAERRIFFKILKANQPFHLPLTDTRQLRQNPSLIH